MLSEVDLISFISIIIDIKKGDFIMATRNKINESRIIFYGIQFKMVQMSQTLIAAHSSRFRTLQQQYGL